MELCLYILDMDMEHCSKLVLLFSRLRDPFISGALPMGMWKSTCSTALKSVLNWSCFSVGFEVHPRVEHCPRGCETCKFHSCWRKTQNDWLWIGNRDTKRNSFVLILFKTFTFINFLLYGRMGHQFYMCKMAPTNLIAVNPQPKSKLFKEN